MTRTLEHSIRHRPSRSISLPQSGTWLCTASSGPSQWRFAAFQFSNRLRARYLEVHRVLGYVYVTSVFISAPFAVVVALKIPKSFSLVAANCMQSFGWLVTTAIALYCVRTGNLIQHRRWMIRSYPFVMVFTA